MAYRQLSPEDVAHFLDHGYVVIRNAFSREKAAEWTANVWTRLGMDPSDKSTWTEERVHMPDHKREKVETFAPKAKNKAWAAIGDLLGGAERIDEKTSTWNDSFIVNLGTPELEDPNSAVAPQDLIDWHVDGDFFVHYLDSPEQALLVIPIFSDIVPGGGGTMICPDSLDCIAKHLAAHPDGVMPEDLVEEAYTEAIQSKRFVELTGQVGDVVLMHPLMPHSASKNHLRIPRIITNPPVGLREPFKLKRERAEDYSLVEKKTLVALGLEELDFEPTTERRRIVPERVLRQQKMLEEETKRLEHDVVRQ